MNRARVGLALAGFVVALLSIAWEDRRLAWGAIALLTGSAILRLLLRKREDRGSGTGAGL
jgi:hypothetical protein